MAAQPQPVPIQNTDGENQKTLTPEEAQKKQKEAFTEQVPEIGMGSGLLQLLIGISLAKAVPRFDIANAIDRLHDPNYAMRLLNARDPQIFAKAVKDFSLVEKESNRQKNKYGKKRDDTQVGTWIFKRIISHDDLARKKNAVTLAQAAHAKLENTENNIKINNTATFLHLEGDSLVQFKKEFQDWRKKNPAGNVDGFLMDKTRKYVCGQNKWNEKKLSKKQKAEIEKKYEGLAGGARVEAIKQEQGMLTAVRTEILKTLDPNNSIQTSDQVAATVFGHTGNASKNEQKPEEKTKTTTQVQSAQSVAPAPQTTATPAPVMTPGPIIAPSPTNIPAAAPIITAGPSISFLANLRSRLFNKPAAATLATGGPGTNLAGSILGRLRGLLGSPGSGIRTGGIGSSLLSRGFSRLAGGAQRLLSNVSNKLVDLGAAVLDKIVPGLGKVTKVLNTAFGNPVGKLVNLVILILISIPVVVVLIPVLIFSSQNKPYVATTYDNRIMISSTDRTVPAVFQNYKWLSFESRYLESIKTKEEVAWINFEKNNLLTPERYLTLKNSH